MHLFGHAIPSKIHSLVGRESSPALALVRDDKIEIEVEVGCAFWAREVSKRTFLVAM